LDLGGESRRPNKPLWILNSSRLVSSRRLVVSSWLNLSLLFVLLACLSSSRLSLHIYWFALLITWCRCARLVRLAWIVLSFQLRIPTNRQHRQPRQPPTRPDPIQLNSSILDARRARQTLIQPNNPSTIATNIDTTTKAHTLANLRRERSTKATTK
jgi:hypothetical protein